MWIGILLFVGVVSAQRSGNQRGSIQSLKSVPLPPRDYVSPRYLREQNEPPKPFSYSYEGPDPYGGFSSHESQGDENGRITGQYTVQNPDGTSRLVRYVADPETGFHAEVETDEEGTKTSEPANASIVSTYPEEQYQAPARRTNDFASGRKKKPAPSARNFDRFAQNRRPSYSSTRAPARFANNAYRTSQGAYRTPARLPAPASNVVPRRKSGLYQQPRSYNALPQNSNYYQQTRPGAYGGASRSSTLNQQRTFRNPSLNFKYDTNSLYRGRQSSLRTTNRPTYGRPTFSSNFPRSNAYRDDYTSQNRISG